jgi:hypothetical protein
VAGFLMVGILLTAKEIREHGNHSCKMKKYAYRYVIQDIYPPTQVLNMANGILRNGTEPRECA